MSSQEILSTPKRRCIRSLTFSEESSSCESTHSSSSQECVTVPDLKVMTYKMMKKREENRSSESLEQLDAARDLALLLSSKGIITISEPLDRIWLACALSELTVVLKTPPFFAQNELVTLTFIVNQLEQLTNEEVEIYNSCVTLMKSLANTNVLCICFSSDQSDDLETFLIRVFDTLFLLVRYDRDDDIKESIFEILYKLCQEVTRDSFPAKCMDTVLRNFLSAKINDAFLLAFRIIENIPAFVLSLNRVVNSRLHAGPTIENEFVVNIDVFNLIKKLHRLIPMSVAPLIGSLELCIYSENIEEKLNAFHLLTYLYTEGNCEGKYVSLWKAFLKRLQTDPLGQEFGLAHISPFLIKKPVLRKELFELLMFYSTMPDINARRKVVNEIVRSSFYYFTRRQMIITRDPYLVDIVAYRRYDVSASVRHAALYGLAEIYENCCSQKLITYFDFELTNKMTTKMTWLLGLILEIFTKETSSWQDKTTVRYLLYHKMLPTHVCATEKMAHLIHLWNAADEDCEAIFHSIQNCSYVIGTHMKVLLQNIKNGEEWKQLHLISEYFDDPERCYDYLKETINYLCQRDKLELLLKLTDVCVACDERIKAKEDLSAVMEHFNDRTPKFFWRLLTWIHDDVIDMESIKVLLNHMMESTNEDTQMSKYITLLYEILFVHPQLGFTEEVVNMLTSMQDSHSLKILKMLSKHQKFEDSTT